jgi:hypothetical protein
VRRQAVNSLLPTLANLGSKGRERFFWVSALEDAPPCARRRPEARFFLITAPIRPTPRGPMSSTKLNKKSPAGKAGLKF